MYVVEDRHVEAASLLGQPFTAPDLLMFELANALWKKARRNEIAPEQAAAALFEATMAITIVPTHQLHRRALEIAIELDHPAYDCFFLALSEAEDMHLVTADDRLVRTCAGSAFAAMIDPL